MLDRGIYAQLLWYLGQTIIYFPVLDVIFGSWAPLIYVCDTTHATQWNLLRNHCILCCMLAMGPPQHATLAVWVRYKRSGHNADITCVPSFYALSTRTAPKRKNHKLLRCFAKTAGNDVSWYSGTSKQQIRTEMNCQVNIKKITSWYSSILHRYGTKLRKRNESSNHWFLMLHAHFRSPTTWKLNGRSWGTILEHTWDLIWRPLFALFTAAQYVVRISRVWRRDFAQTPVMIPWWYKHTNKQPQRYHNSRSENVTHDTFPSSMTQWMQDGSSWSE